MRNIKFKIFSLNTLAYLLIIIYIVIFVILSFSRHDALKTYLNDLGTYDQIVWNSLHGRLFQTSGGIYANTESFSYLSGHFSPILLIFIPFYLIWSSAKMLLLLQVIAVGLAGLPVYWLARDKIKSKPLHQNVWCGGELAGLVFLISYLLYPILHNALSYDFHEVTFAVPFVTFALYFLYKKRYVWMSIFLALICLSVEHLVLIVFMFGLYLMFINKKWRMGGIIAFLSFAYFILVVTVIMPSFSVTHGVDILKSPTGGPTRYAWLGSSVGEIAKTIFTKPFYVLKNIFSSQRINFLITLLIPVFGLPLFSAVFLLALPVLLIYFLSSWGFTYSVYYYHSAPLAGIIYIAAIFSFARLIKTPKLQKLFLVLILISSFLISYFNTITPLSKDYTWQDYQPSPHAKLLKEVAKQIPANASLSVQHNLGPHFTHRRELYSLFQKISNTDYILIDAYNPYYGESKKQFYGFVNILASPINDWAETVKNIFADERYGLVYDNDGYFIFQKGAARDNNEKGFMHFAQYFKNIVDDLEAHDKL